MLRKLGWAAVGHQALNLAAQADTLALPLLVTALLSATANAYFYAAWLVAGVLFMVEAALTLAVYAAGARAPATLPHRLRFTLGASLLLALLGNAVLLVAGRTLLSFIGQSYADQATLVTCILALGAVPLAVREHWVVVNRVSGSMLRSALFLSAAGLLELVLAAIGAHLGGLPGLSVGWLARSGSRPP